MPKCPLVNSNYVNMYCQLILFGKGLCSKYVMFNIVGSRKNTFLQFVLRQMRLRRDDLTWGLLQMRTWGRTSHWVAVTGPSMNNLAYS